jgi:hypothetical protein
MRRRPAKFTELPRRPAFANRLQALFKKFPKSEKAITGILEGLKDDPFQGDRLSGIGSAHVRKLRIPLKDYEIGKSAGLPVLFLLDEIGCRLLFVVIYHKGKGLKEHEILNLAKDVVREHLD